MIQRLYDLRAWWYAVRGAYHDERGVGWSRYVAARRAWRQWSIVRHAAAQRHGPRIRRDDFR